MVKPSTTIRYGMGVEDLDALQPLWNALQEHHSVVLPVLGDRARPRSLDEAWGRRRAKYETWLAEPETFFAIAECGGGPVGYAFVTVGPGYAGWATGGLAELETLSVLPEHRSGRIGSQLIDAVWSRLDGLGIDEMAVTTALTNVESHRFYERHGFRQAFVIYYGKRDATL